METFCNNSYRYTNTQDRRQPYMALLHLFFLFLLHSFYTEAQQYPLCEGGNYTANSAFGSNLNLLLANLSSSKSIFSNATIGTSPNVVYGLVLCRGDLDPSSCNTCYEMLSLNVTQLCPYSTRATVWDRKCELRYSDTDFFSSIDPTETFSGLCNGVKSTDSFANMSRELFQNVSYEAAFNSSLMFATGMLSYSKPPIYALAQCTMDLSSEVCRQCLQREFDSFWSAWKTQEGGWYFGKSCNYRYETAQFYQGKTTLLPTLPPSLPLAPTPLVSSPGTGEAASQNRGGKKKKASEVLHIILISLAVALVLIATLCIFFWKRSIKTTSGKMEEIIKAESLLFDLKILKVATDNFSDSNKLGQGGFGTVYKGILPDGQEIAVKRLSASSSQGLGELKNELLLIAKLQHKNLVRLRGVCLEEKEKLLVYEFVPNRSLDTFLYDPIKRSELSWAKRFEIIGGIARGLRYLHEESHLKIIHRDLKASNVLIDADLNPKISDFGLARLFGVNETHNTTIKVVGTFGYMAPEYAMRGRFSVKLDVFSFGILVLEIVTGRKNSFHSSEHAKDLLSYTWEHWSEDSALEIVDPSLCEQFSRDETLRCIQIGLLCVQDDPANRPIMSSIVLMLHGPSMALQSPLQPILGAGGSTTDSSVSIRRSVLSSIDRPASRVVISVEDVAISELHA